MPKSNPTERWRLHVAERYQSFQHSAEIKRLRRQGLAALGRKKRLTFEDFDREFWGGKVETNAYRDYQRDCREVGARFGLAPWTVEWACVIKGYVPDQSLYPAEARWPRVFVVTNVEEGPFLKWLVHEALQLGLTVSHQGDGESVVLLGGRPETPLEGSQLPPLYSAFQMSVQIPPGYYPPEAAAELGRQATQQGKELATQLGYSIPQRIRNSPLVSQADEFQVSKDTLASGAVYDIVDAVYGEQDFADSSKLRNRAKSARHRVKRRLADRSPKDKADTL